VAAGEAVGRIYSGGFLGALFPSVPLEQRLALGGNLVKGCLGSAAFLAVGGVLLGRCERAVPASLLVACVGLNLWVAQRNLYWVVRPSILTETPGFLQQIEAKDGKPALGRFRVVSYAPNAPLEGRPEGVSMAEYVSSFEALALKSAIPSLFGLESRNDYLPAANRRVLARLKPYADSGLLNTRYLVLVPEAAKRRAKAEDVVADAQGQDLMLVRAPDFVERVYLAQPRCVADASAAVALIDGGDFRRGTDAAVECGGWRPPPPPFASSSEALGSAQLLSEEPDQVKVRVEASQDALLVLNDAYYDGWSARVDGHAAPILPTNAMVRGVPVTRGTHAVDFRYEPPGFGLGLAISGAALVMVTLVLRFLGILFRVDFRVAAQPHNPARVEAHSIRSCLRGRPGTDW
jgi:hypothetical protein